MQAYTYIKTLYTPVQPAVDPIAGNVIYNEWLPAPALQHYIYCYWQLKTREPLQEPFHYRVVADGCIDIFFELNNPQENFVMGFCKKFTEFPLHHTFHYIGIRFLPTMFPQLFNVNAASISNRFAPLCQVVPAAARFIAGNFFIEQQPDEIQSILDSYFLSQAAATNLNNDNRLYEAIHLILEHCGMIDIEKDLSTGISSRQLRRLFTFYVGDTAKTFCKVVRFQNILKAKPSGQSLRQNKLFFDAGYYDQSHFIKEFKHFYGVTPNRAFGR